MEQMFLLFFTKHVYICLTYLLINLKLPLKQLEVKVDFSILEIYIIIYINLFENAQQIELGQERENIHYFTVSLFLYLLTNSPCFPTIFIIFMFAPLRILSCQYFLLKIYCFLVLFCFLPPCSSLNKLLFVQNFFY